MTIKEFDKHLQNKYPCQVLNPKSVVYQKNINEETRNKLQKICDEKKTTN